MNRNEISFSRQERSALAIRIRDFVRDELEQDISLLQAEMTLDFFGKEIGAWFYNRGLYDAQAVVSAKSEDIVEAIAGLERAEP